MARDFVIVFEMCRYEYNASSAYWMEAHQPLLLKRTNPDTNNYECCQN